MISLSTSSGATAAAKTLLSTPTGKGANLSSVAQTTSNSSNNPLAETFSDILEESINGLTKVVSQVAYKRMAEFLEDHDRLRAFAQAAGWAPTGGSTSGTSSGSSATSTGASGSTGNDPVTRLLVALGQTLLLAIEQSQTGSGSNGSTADNSETTGSDSGSG